MAIVADSYTSGGPIMATASAIDANPDGSDRPVGCLSLARNGVA
jgi:hypothetical protein